MKSRPADLLASLRELLVLLKLPLRAIPAPDLVSYDRLLAMGTAR